MERSSSHALGNKLPTYCPNRPLFSCMRYSVHVQAAIDLYSGGISDRSKCFLRANRDRIVKEMLNGKANRNVSIFRERFLAAAYIDAASALYRTLLRKDFNFHCQIRTVMIEK